MDVDLASLLAGPRQRSGVILEISAVGITAPAIFGVPYVRAVDGTVYRLPEALSRWAIRLIAVHSYYLITRELSIFPCHIGFGGRDGAVYAELLSDAVTAGPRHEQGCSSLVL
ncbi:hypothetical protein BJY24_005549 [Nocardia transvalensis]|uniref:Uncharacterized protein n=1 Tax=Nocardia transvalensis TaxID=37333 RepID=A0A7W9UKT4_9NOCA|nr:hypothetical protein [Nocardia transvalensis]MBB5916637.1 hypothetical protein [Nocardia transvalensis]